MILESIELKNIRSYDDQKIEFPKGITLFEGDIGSGKSSILMAVEFALFGTGSQKGDTLLSKKAKDGSVILCFQVDGINYEAKRDLKRTAKSVGQHPKNCHLKVSDEIQPLAPGELKQEILKILKFNEPASPNAQSKIYRYAIFTPQEEMKQILLDSGTRLETIRRAFGVEDYKKAGDNAERINRSINTKLKILKDRLKNADENEFNVKAWETKTKKLKSQLEIIQKEKTELEKNLATKKSDKKKLDEKNSEKLNIENQKQQMKIKLDAKNSQIIEYSERISEIKDEIGEKDDEINGIKNTKIPSKLTEKEIDGKINGIEKLNTEKIEYESKKKNFEENMSELQKLGNECMYCHQKITKEHQTKMADEGRAEIGKIESNLIQIDDQIVKLLSGVEVDKKEETNVIIRKLMDLKSDLKFYEESKGKISQLQGTQKKLKEKLHEKQKSIGVLRKENEDLKKQIDKISSTIQSLPDFDKELKIIQKEEDVIQSNLTSKMQKFGNMEGEIHNAEGQVTLWEAKVVEAEDWKTQHKKLVDYHTWIKEFFIPTVNEIEKQVLISIQQDFNETYRRWFKILIDDSSKESRLDENFTPILEQDGFEQDFYNLSGGEQTSVSLAYRLSLNTMMRKNTDSLKSNLLILDEPTNGFSKNQLSKVKDVLRELKSEQIILVSHEKELETYVDNVFQISKSEGYSRVTRMN